MEIVLNLDAYSTKEARLETAQSPTSASTKGKPHLVSDFLFVQMLILSIMYFLVFSPKLWVGRGQESKTFLC